MTEQEVFPRAHDSYLVRIISWNDRWIDADDLLDELTTALIRRQHIKILGTPVDVDDWSVEVTEL